MTLDVFATPAAIAPGIEKTATAVIDVFRASTTITATLAAGARCMLPAADVEQALRLVEPYRPDEAVLGGERDCVRIEGFALGNSPGEYTRETVAGRVIVFTTTNGTAALRAVADARRAVVGCFLNLTAVAADLAGEPQVALVCAGNQGRFSLEDFTCAGALAARAVWRGLGRTLTKSLLATDHARRLAELGFRADLEFALRVDSAPVVPRLADGRITR